MRALTSFAIVTSDGRTTSRWPLPAERIMEVFPIYERQANSERPSWDSTTKSNHNQVSVIVSNMYGCILWSCFCVYTNVEYSSHLIHWSPQPVPFCSINYLTLRFNISSGKKKSIHEGNLTFHCCVGQQRSARELLKNGNSGIQNRSEKIHIVEEYY